MCCCLLFVVHGLLVVACRLLSMILSFGRSTLMFVVLFIISCLVNMCLLIVVRVYYMMIIGVCLLVVVLGVVGSWLLFVVCGFVVCHVCLS